MRFVVSQQFFDRIPDAIFGVQVASQIDNRELNPAIEKRLQYQIQATKQQFASQNMLAQNADVQLYRLANQCLDSQSLVRKSLIEQVLTAAIHNQLRSKNAIDDLCQLVMLTHHVTVQAIDLTKLINQELTLRPAAQTDQRQVAKLQYGEPIYTSQSVFFGSWNQQFQATEQVQKQTKQLVLVVEGFGANRTNLLAAQAELTRGLREYFGVRANSGLITQTSTDWTDQQNATQTQ